MVKYAFLDLSVSRSDYGLNKTNVGRERGRRREGGKSCKYVFHKIRKLNEIFCLIELENAHEVKKCISGDFRFLIEGNIYKLLRLTIFYN